MKGLCSILFTLALCLGSHAQSYVVKDIKLFGAKGDGKTNDHAAFEKAAAFFNARSGHGKLVIPAGTYVVGKQLFTKGKSGKPAYEGVNVLDFKNVKDLTIEGTRTSKLKYASGFRFGAFNPETGKAHEHGSNLFVKYDWAAFVGQAILVSESEDVIIKNLELDGNNAGLILGGVYGDVGRQVQHTGIYIINSREVDIDSVNAHHFGLDGMIISNTWKKKDDEITLSNSSFEYNGRQGLSWVGGNELVVKNCKFNHTGQGKIFSRPGAGVDIEAEVGPVRNGKFENCEFINNKGLGMGADSGDSGDCEFDNCTFWGLESWSLWIAKPGFTVRNSRIYGSFVHGFDASNDKEATKFINCDFEDKSYNGKRAYGTYLVESNGKRRLQFKDSRFTSNQNKLVWVEGTFQSNDEKYQFDHCTFVIKNNNLPKGDFISKFNGISYRNCSFEFKRSAKEKKYFLNDIDKNTNADKGGNKIVYEQ